MDNVFLTALKTNLDDIKTHFRRKRINNKGEKIGKLNIQHFESIKSKPFIKKSFLTDELISPFSSPTTTLGLLPYTTTSTNTETSNVLEREERKIKQIDPTFLKNMDTKMNFRKYTKTLKVGKLDPRIGKSLSQKLFFNIDLEEEKQIGKLDISRQRYLESILVFQKYEDKKVNSILHAEYKRIKNNIPQKIDSQRKQLLMDKLPFRDYTQKQEVGQLCRNRCLEFESLFSQISSPKKEEKLLINWDEDCPKPPLTMTTSSNLWLEDQSSHLGGREGNKSTFNPLPSTNSRCLSSLPNLPFYNSADRGIILGKMPFLNRGSVIDNEIFKNKIIFLFREKQLGVYTAYILLELEKIDFSIQTIRRKVSTLYNWNYYLEMFANFNYYEPKMKNEELEALLKISDIPKRHLQSHQHILFKICFEGHINETFRPYLFNQNKKQVFWDRVIDSPFSMEFLREKMNKNSSIYEYIDESRYS